MKTARIGRQRRPSSPRQYLLFLQSNNTLEAQAVSRSWATGSRVYLSANVQDKSQVFALLRPWLSVRGGTTGVGRPMLSRFITWLVRILRIRER